VAAGIRDGLRGKDPAGFRRAMTIIAVLAVTTCGYVRGRSLPTAPESPAAGPHAPHTSWREIN
jgi:hypothetical protein